MKDKNKSIDPLPDSFETEEKAGAFWDAHSTMDYQEYLEMDISQLSPKDVLKDGAFEEYDAGMGVPLFGPCRPQHDYLFGGTDNRVPF